MLLLKKPSLKTRISSFVRWTIGLIVLCFDLCIVIPLAFMVSKKCIDRLLRIFSKHMTFIAGLKIKTVGLKNIRSPAIFVFNHTNVFDHFALFPIFPSPTRGIEKEDHFRWPLYGLFLKSIGQIPIAPKGNTQKAIESLEKAKELFSQGVSIAIAPEGTRSPDGQLGDFKKGAFHLAIDLKADIVPIVLKGMHEFNQKNSLIIHPGEVEIKVLAPVSTKTKAKGDVDQLRNEIRNQILNVLQEGPRT